VWAGVVASVASGYFLQRPNVTVEPDFLQNEREPFSAYFRVKNDGYFSVYDLSFSCSFTGGPFKDAETSGSRGQEAERELIPGESATKNCSVKGVRFQGQASLVFTIRFRPSFWPWQASKHERFAATQDNRGVYHWIHQPLVR
jgi:hypothetical protein